MGVIHFSGEVRWQGCRPTFHFLRAINCTSTVSPLVGRSLLVDSGLLLIDGRSGQPTFVHVRDADHAFPHGPHFGEHPSNRYGRQTAPFVFQERCDRRLLSFLKAGPGTRVSGYPGIKFPGIRVPRYLGARVSVYPGTRVPGYSNIKPPGYPDIRISQCPGTRVFRYPGIQIPGYPSTRVSRYPGIRVSGCSGTGVSNYPGIRYPST